MKWMLLWISDLMCPVLCRYLWTSIIQRRRSTRCLYRESHESQWWVYTVCPISQYPIFGISHSAPVLKRWMLLHHLRGVICFMKLLAPISRKSYDAVNVVDIFSKPWILQISFPSFSSLRWYWSHLFIAELQPCPRAWPQAHDDRWVGCVGEAQRRPDDHQETHREDGGGEFFSYFTFPSQG